MGPFPTAQELVQQQYRDFLNREGDAEGVENWSLAITTQTLTAPQVIDGFMGSLEFAGRVAPVVRLYFATFLRIPDYEGLQTWIAAGQAGWTLEAIADEFTTSAEFLLTYGSLDDTEFVTLLYQNILNRQPDPTGLANWTGRLSNGATRGEILVGFSESPEYRGKLQNSVDVTMAYVGMLRRAPEQRGFDGWLLAMDAGLSREGLIAGFFGSNEYAGRFV